MTSVLIVVLCVLAIWSGRTAALAFALLTVLHDQFFSCIVGWGYYLSAGAVDLAALAVMATLARPSRLTTGFVRVCQTSVFLNFYGWGLWLSGYPPVTYDISFVGLYSVAIYVILRGDAVKNERCDNFRIFSDIRCKGIMAWRSISKEAGN